MEDKIGKIGKKGKIKYRRKRWIRKQKIERKIGKKFKIINA